MTRDEKAPPELLALAGASLPTEPASKSAARRAALWPPFLMAFERARVAASTRRTLRRTAGAVAMAAAVIAAAWWGGPVTAEPRLQITSRLRPLVIAPPRVAALVGATVEEAGTMLDLANGVKVRVERGTTLGFAEDGLRVDLERGAASFRVPKLPLPEIFSVWTPDAEVVVHGTEFAVAVRDRAQGAGTRTSVSVREGLVAVHHDGTVTMLRAGDAWSSDPAAAATRGSVDARAPATKPAPRECAAAPAPAASVTAGEPPKPPAQPASGAPGTMGETPKPPASALAEQNELFERAMAARRTGDDRETVRLLDELRAAYPSSPLDAVVRRQRARAVERLEASQRDRLGL